MTASTTTAGTATSTDVDVVRAVFGAFAVGDLVSDYVGPRQIAALFDVMSEVNELLIAAAGCLYLWLKSKELLGTSSTSSASSASSASSTP